MNFRLVRARASMCMSACARVHGYVSGVSARVHGYDAHIHGKPSTDEMRMTPTRTSKRRGHARHAQALRRE
eukprot:6204855-Pleurochrysis_carterae.AAC.2